MTNYYGLFRIEASDNSSQFYIRDKQNQIVASVSVTSKTSFTLTSYVNMDYEMLDAIRNLCKEKLLV